MKVLIVGESWSTHLIHIKGFDTFNNSTWESGAKWLKEGLEAHGIDVHYLPNHEASVGFPTKLGDLKAYSVIYLSDIGANTLLLHPDTFTRSIRTPNRLKLLKEYVEDGGGLGMIGGYLTFQGIDAKGHWHGTPVEEVLPVDIQPTDDRVEVPEGFTPRVVNPHHPVLAGIPKEWPWFLGYNKLQAKPDAEVLLKYEGDPFVAVRSYVKGRTGVFASDCAPHWGPPEFINWGYYAQFWVQLTRWLAGDAK